MTDNMETPTGTPGAAGVPTPTPSGTVGQTSAVDVETLKKALEPFITDLVERKTQSTKDKRIAGLQGQVSDFEAKLARLEELRESGMSQKNAMEFMKLEDAVLAHAPANSQAAPQGEAAGTRETAAGVDTKSILQAMGLDANDPAVGEVLRSKSDPLEQTVEFAKLAAARRSQPKPNPAQQMPAGGGISIQGETKESLTAALKAELEKPVHNFAKIKELNEKVKLAE